MRTTRNGPSTPRPWWSGARRASPRRAGRGLSGVRGGHRNGGDGVARRAALGWGPRFSCELAWGFKQRMAMRRRSWVNGVDEFVDVPWVGGFRLVQNVGTGLLIQGNREWRDVAVEADITTDLATSAGIAVRVQGMRRYYALLLHREGDVRLVKRAGGDEVLLASQPFEWHPAETYDLLLEVRGQSLSASVNGKALLSAKDADLECGGMALVVEEGCSSSARVTVAPA